MGTLEFLKYKETLLKKLLNTTDEKILKKIEEVFNKENNEDFEKYLSENESCNEEGTCE